MVCVLLLGVPLGVVATRLIRDEAQRGVNRDAVPVAAVWLVVSGLAIVALGAAVGLARLQARRLVRPLEDLVESAERLGSGDPTPTSRRYEVPEIDRVAQVLDNSAERIGRLLSAERELAANASHQLRTPLTALSMRLEEILATAGDAAVRDEAKAALAAAERLACVVDSLLVQHARSARTEAAELVDIDDILEQQRVEWEPAFRRVGRKLSVAGRRGLKACANPAVLAQVVATLIDNALTHGGGAVRLRTRHSEDHVILEVADEGHGIPDLVAPHIFERSFSGSSSTGLGLSLARDLIETDGGRLELTRARPAVFAIFLTSDTPASRARPSVHTGAVVAGSSSRGTPSASMNTHRR